MPAGSSSVIAMRGRGLSQPMYASVTVMRAGDGPVLREKDLSTPPQLGGAAGCSWTLSWIGAMVAPPALVAPIERYEIAGGAAFAGTTRRATKRSTWPGARTIGFASGTAPSGCPSLFPSGKSVID